MEQISFNVEVLKTGRWVIYPKDVEELHELQDLLAENGIVTVLGNHRFNCSVDKTASTNGIAIGEGIVYPSPDKSRTAYLLTPQNIRDIPDYVDKIKWKDSKFAEGTHWLTAHGRGVIITEVHFDKTFTTGEHNYNKEGLCISICANAEELQLVEPWNKSLPEVPVSKFTLGSKWETADGRCMEVTEITKGYFIAGGIYYLHKDNGKSNIHNLFPELELIKPWIEFEEDSNIINIKVNTDVSFLEDSLPKTEFIPSNFAPSPENFWKVQTDYPFIEEDRARVESGELSEQHFEDRYPGEELWKT